MSFFLFMFLPLQENLSEKGQNSAPAFLNPYLCRKVLDKALDLLHIHTLTFTPASLRRAAGHLTHLVG